MEIKAVVLTVFLKQRMRDFKESNIILVKLWIALVSKVAELTEGLTKRAAMSFIPGVIEKMGDVKFKAGATECLMNVGACLGPGFVCRAVLKQASDAKNPNVIKEACNLLTAIPLEFASAEGLPLKEILDFGKCSIANSNIAVRKAATDMLVNFY